MAEQNQRTNMPDNGPEFAIQRLYIKDLSFEAPRSPQVFLEEWQPELNMDLATKVNDLGEDNHEVVLTVTVTVTMKESHIFLAEVQQGGIFTIKNFPKEEMRPMLGSFCPNILYPYAREAITDMVVRGGFPQLYLTPVNFDALFEQHEQSKEENSGTEDRVH
ncbi:protein-export chaperone SecB [Coxiella endosymbiont of Ornithodoros amblus]|uniref:protein-export chaperone SecB n=1 Tax=Coxiella endosymbiont of Ornithodoros amblus TaxID=1656166 RepID=UPI00244E5180|nr:protein-export chaperone SecB [Coxiella endosymbiont of Ornithodoros amblus]MBW5802684.1 protein-export chaperone SecB [Coxiella endosymbiont of Ornithodoros amblus]